MKLWPFSKKSKSATERFVDLADLGLYGFESGTGKRVTPLTALRVSAVLACVSRIADGVAMAPLRVYEKQENGQKREVRSKTSRLLTARPNAFQTSYEWKRMMTAHAVLTGKGVSLLTWRGDEVVEAFPLLPEWVDVRRGLDGSPVYYLATPFGETGIISSKRILHLKNMSWTGLDGLEHVQLAREAIGLAMSTEEHHAKLHANGGRPGGILSSENHLTEDQIKKIAKSWKAAFGGSQNAFKTAVLDGNMKFMSVSSTGVDSEHIATRRFEVEEIARFFNVFPQMIQYTEKTATFASAEAFFQAHVTYTLGPWFENWRQLLDEFFLDGDGPLFVNFDDRQLTRAPLKDRALAYRSYAEMGIYTRNELRELEGLPPLEGGDELLTPMNMQPGSQGVTDDSENDSSAAKS